MRSCSGYFVLAKELCIRCSGTNILVKVYWLTCSGHCVMDKKYECIIQNSKTLKYLK